MKLQKDDVTRTTGVRAGLSSCGVVGGPEQACLPPALGFFLNLFFSDFFVELEKGKKKWDLRVYKINLISLD